ncbi:STAS domain-containing protein [Amycolatopsis sp. OK19-0408]|uniref:Anti-sigma factor antagonist n=1 Tax=Amycolatopsis iheyensis TaxID=2945988 RepID=A0A9X2N8J3_9PSEU|nr:STAS domain-containing protein [Amycolatopsis iheyensis]MCR6483989.1 STAS domain-containing protein [Amycolatopsis iheyensis]
MTDHRTRNHLVTTTEAGVVIVHCPGDLDLATSPRMRDALLTPLGEGARGVIADLTETTYCDSTVFSVLVEAYRASLAHDVPFTIAAAHATVARPLAILGLDRVLPIRPTVAEAREAVTGTPVTKVS